MIPAVGRTVHYKLSEFDASRINAVNDEVGAALGLQANRVEPNDFLPLIITKVWAEPGEATNDTLVNGQVLVDGNFQLWVTMVGQGHRAGQWHDPKEG